MLKKLFHEMAAINLISRFFGGGDFKNPTFYNGTPYIILQFYVLTDFRRDLYLWQQSKVGFVSTFLKTLNFTHKIIAIAFATPINEQFTSSL